MRTRVVTTLPSVEPAQIKSIVHVAKSRCAFVNFRDRASAETAAQAWASGLEIDGESVVVKWGRSRPAKAPVNAVAGVEAAGAGPSTFEVVTT